MTPALTHSPNPSFYLTSPPVFVTSPPNPAPPIPCFMDIIVLPVRLSQIFKDGTLFFSRSTPSLATVIPAMDHIDEALTTQSLNKKYEPSIRAALGLAKKTLNRYYNMTDHSEVYRIAMGTYFLFFFSIVIEILTSCSSFTSASQIAILCQCRLGA